MAVASPTLRMIAQQDFSLGSVQSVARNLIPSSGVYEIRNGLVNQEGAITKRGGSVYYSTAGPDSSGLGLWAGQVGAGFRTLGWTNAHTFALNGTTPVTLSTQTPAKPARGTVIGGLLFLDGGYVYGGSLKTAAYTTGTVTVTNGSATVTGSGTTWTGNVDVGMIFSTGIRFFWVKSVDSNTQITLNDSWADPTVSGASYSLSPFAKMGPGIAIWQVGSLFAGVGSKLLIGNGQRVYESAPPNDQALAQPMQFPGNNYIDLPDGSTVTGIAAIRGAALIFGTNGLWVLSNVALDLVDVNGNPQQSLQQMSAEVKLWAREGLASWSNAVVAPCLDDVYLIDGVSIPQPISRSITPTYRAYVQAGYVPGLASVHANHYVLPILDPSNAYAVKACLVCRLDRPVRTPFGTFYAWGFLDGAGGSVTGVATQNLGTAAPKLLASGGSNRLLEVTGWFASSGATDHDGSVPTLDVTFGDIPTGQGFRNPNHVKFMRLNYELATVGTASIQAFVGDERRADQNTFTQLSSTAPSTPTSQPFKPYAWKVNQSVRYLRPRFKSSGPGTSTVIRGLELDVRPSLR